MEYILEELLRQRRALAALMTGEMPEEQESGGTGTGNGPDTALPGSSTMPSWNQTTPDGQTLTGLIKADRGAKV